MGILWPLRGAHGQPQYLNMAFNIDYSILMGPKCEKKPFYLLHPLHQPELLKQDRLGLWTHDIGTKF